MSPTQARRLVRVIRFFGVLDCLALAVAFIPRSWIEAMHGQMGMGPFPGEPIAGYLARSGSLMYVLHGVTVLYVSGDVKRYEALIRFLAYVALAHGAMLLWVDWLEGMPAWWKWLEGPLFAASGLVVLVMMGFRDRHP